MEPQLRRNLQGLIDEWYTFAKDGGMNTDVADAQLVLPKGKLRGLVVGHWANSEKGLRDTGTDTLAQSRCWMPGLVDLMISCSLISVSTACSTVSMLGHTC